MSIDHQNSSTERLQNVLTLLLLGENTTSNYHESDKNGSFEAIFHLPFQDICVWRFHKKNHEKNLKILQVMPLLKITDFLQNFPPDISGRRAIFSLKAL